MKFALFVGVNVLFTLKMIAYIGQEIPYLHSTLAVLLGIAKPKSSLPKGCYKIFAVNCDGSTRTHMLAHFSKSILLHFLYPDSRSAKVSTLGTKNFQSYSTTKW